MSAPPSQALNGLRRRGADQLRGILSVSPMRAANLMSVCSRICVSSGRKILPPQATHTVLLFASAWFAYGSSREPATQCAKNCQGNPGKLRCFPVNSTHLVSSVVDLPSGNEKTDRDRVACWFECLAQNHLYWDGNQPLSTQSRKHHSGVVSVL